MYVCSCFDKYIDAATWPLEQKFLTQLLYIYIYIYMCVCVPCIYICVCVYHAPRLTCSDLTQKRKKKK